MRLSGRRLLATALAVLVCAGPAAAATPQAGWYRGTVAKALIGFRVSGGKVRLLRTGSLRLTCSDGTRRAAGISPTARSWTVRVRRGRFSANTAGHTVSSSGTLRFAGRFISRRRARGTLRVHLRYRDGAACDTGTRRFTATRRGGEPFPAPAQRIFAGRAAGNTLLEVAMSADGTTLRPRRMQAKMQCVDGSTVTLDVRNPTDPAVAANATFRGSWRFTPPKIPGHPDPSGGGIELSGRVTDTGLDGAARLGIGFVDGTSCDSGWLRFTCAGATGKALG